MMTNGKIFIFRMTAVVVVCCFGTLLFQSCKTTKIREKESIQSAETVFQDKFSQTLEKTSRETTGIQRDSTEVHTNMAEKVIHIKWSAPDSAGVQYVSETTVINRGRQSVSRSVSKSEDTNRERYETLENISEKTHVESDFKSETNKKEETQSNTSVWFTIVEIVLLCFLIYLLYNTLTRTKK